jgi:hypothetical protein
VPGGGRWTACSSPRARARGELHFDGDLIARSTISISARISPARVAKSAAMSCSSTLERRYDAR